MGLAARHCCRACKTCARPGLGWTREWAGVKSWLASPTEVLGTAFMVRGGAPNRCTVCGGLLVEDPRRMRDRIYCVECQRPWCERCGVNHDPGRHLRADQ